MTKTNCPECDSSFDVQEDAIVGEIVSCPDCGADYEVASLENGTIVVKAAESVKEDWGE
jgi:alpha-aminoadipate/glutamate carrier protein LysW